MTKILGSLFKGIVILGSWIFGALLWIYLMVIKWSIFMVLAILVTAFTLR